MFASKIFYLFVVAGLLTFSNVGSAIVYDFGVLGTSLRVSTDRNYDYKDDAFANSMNFDFTASSIGQPESSFTGGPQNGGAPFYSSNVSDMSYNQFQRGVRNRHSDDDWIKRSDKYTPITSPVPEPETYAMFLAGIALIIFTARSRIRKV